MEFDPKELPKVDIKSLALNKDKLGSLIFETSYPLLEKLRDLFVELEELGFEKTLTTEEVNNVLNLRNQFLAFLKRLSEFDIAHSNPKQLHDSFENEVQNFYNNALKHLRTPLVFLRQEAARRSQSGKDLATEQKAAAKARKEYEEMSVELKAELEKLKAQKQEIETTHGEVASKQLAMHFKREAAEHREQAATWLGSRTLFYKWLMAIIITNFVLYFGLFLSQKLGWTTWQIEDFFTLQYGIGKLALITLLWYGMNFASKNYAVESHLEAINQHRRNVAQTLEDFLATNPNPETLSEMLKNGTTAMFEHLQVGHLRKEEVREDGSPMQEIVNILTPRKE